MNDVMRPVEGLFARRLRWLATPNGGGIPTVVVALLVAWSWCAPAHAQRLGRRFRQPAPAPRAPAAAPARPAPAAVAPGTPGRSPAPASGQRGGAAGSGEKPQTTAAPARSPSPAGPAAPEAPTSIAAADVAWDGVVPFGVEWRRRHPAAWRADAGSAEILLTAGTDGPTRAERTQAAPATDPEPLSVLEPAAKEADLLVFPSEPSGDPAATPTPAADGTVSVLARDGAALPSSRDRGDAEAADLETGVVRAGGSLASGADEQQGASGAPWLALGAFAAVPEEQAAAATPHVFMELSLHRDGAVRGNYYDALADVVHPIVGRIDRDAGTLAWRVGNGPEFLADAEGLATGRARVTVRKGATERSLTLIALD